GPVVERLFSKLERVTLTQGEVVQEPESLIEYVYFPETAVFSMLAMMQNGDTVEVGPVGDEGLVGLRVFLGADTARYQALVHVAGTAMRTRSDALREALSAEESALPRLLTRYTQMLLAMTGQSSACNKLHRLDEQLARWLLMMDDYVGDELLLTHELISLTLGVRRAGISDAANEMRDAGLIAYQRGRIRILDRTGLEQRACECYRAIKEEYDHLYADLPQL
ncbi:MAG TPA: Crp/Fnr family transcriptional regulator, partial [Pyrinomonadaceae bacterium]|nr:Crp/Fnr family transcriptional regulator [Pyrinomonadaceae bacterium]